MTAVKAFRGVYVLMAGKCEDDDWKTAQGVNRACPMAHADWTSIGHCVSLDEVVHDQDNQVGHGYQGRNAGVFQRV